MHEDDRFQLEMTLEIAVRFVEERQVEVAKAVGDPEAHSIAFNRLLRATALRSSISSVLRECEVSD